jgi:hypothetical protein
MGRPFFKHVGRGDHPLNWFSGNHSGEIPEELDPGVTRLDAGARAKLSWVQLAPNRYQWIQSWHCHYRKARLDRQRGCHLKVKVDLASTDSKFLSYSDSMMSSPAGGYASVLTGPTTLSYGFQESKE